MASVANVAYYFTRCPNLPDFTLVDFPDSVHSACDNYDKSCFKCIDGRYLTTNEIGTYICQECNPRCSKCSDNVTCSECKHQQYLGRDVNMTAITVIITFVTEILVVLRDVLLVSTRIFLADKDMNVLVVPSHVLHATRLHRVSPANQVVGEPIVKIIAPLTVVTCASMDICLTCKSGFNGASCQHDCWSCNGRICDRDTGNCKIVCSLSQYFDEADGMFRGCPDGCTNCTNASHCKAYTEGWWGNRCQNFCDVHCTNNLCHENNCSCINGYVGESAVGKHQCSKGFWGPECQFQCGPGCMGSICNKTTGRCQYGCMAGCWTTLRYRM